MIFVIQLKFKSSPPKHATFPDLGSRPTKLKTLKKEFLHSVQTGGGDGVHTGKGKEMHV